MEQCEIRVKHSDTIVEHRDTTVEYCDTIVEHVTPQWSIVAPY